MQISQLSNELQLDRQEVLQWLKDHTARSETCALSHLRHSVTARPCTETMANLAVPGRWVIMPTECAADRARDNMRQVAAAADAAADERKALLRASRDRGRSTDSTPAADSPSHAAAAETQRSAPASASVPFASERSCYCTLIVLCPDHAGLAHRPLSAERLRLTASAS